MNMAITATSGGITSENKNILLADCTKLKFELHRELILKWESKYL